MPSNCDGSIMTKYRLSWGSWTHSILVHDIVKKIDVMYKIREVQEGSLSISKWDMNIHSDWRLL